MAQLIKTGAQGEQVTALQNNLQKLGFTLDADGHFGPATKGAVEDLQAIFGYNVDGIVGDATQKLIDQQLGLGFSATAPDAIKRGLDAQGKGGQGPAPARLLKRGTEGADVRYLQRALVALGYSLGIDGKFGDATDKAVRALQQAFGYTVDGIAGEGTFKLIYQQLGYGWRADKAPNA